MDAAPRHIEIDVDPGAVPITGHVHARGEAVRPFTGWTALFAALRATLSEEGVAPGSAADDGSADTRGGH
jgi:hypothetical protein